MSIKHFFLGLAVGLTLILIASSVLAQERSSKVFTKLDKTINYGMSTYKLPGIAVCTARRQRIIFCRNYGYAEAATGRQVTSHTPFLSGSITKTFTAIAMMGLVERGVISLDDSVAELVDFELGHPHKESLTLRHLLTHTASIAVENQPLHYTLNPELDVPLAELTRRYFALGGQYYDPANYFSDAPGTRKLYSNMGFVMLGRIGELVSGTDFRSLVQTEILDRLDMTNSSFYLNAIDDRAAIPHVWNVKNNSYDTYPPYTFSEYPAGGLYTSAHDLAKYAAAVGNPRLLEARGVLNRTSRAELLRRQISNIDPMQAIGFTYDEVDGNVVYGHDGSVGGGITRMWIRERDGLSVVMLSNGTPIVARENLSQLRAWLDQVRSRLFETATAVK